MQAREDILATLNGTLKEKVPTLLNPYSVARDNRMAKFTDLPPGDFTSCLPLPVGFSDWLHDPPPYLENGKIAKKRRWRRPRA